MSNVFSRHSAIVRNLSLVCLLAVCPLEAVGQASQQQGVGVQSGLGSTDGSGPLVIGAGDLLDVEVFNTPELSGRLRVDSFGRVTLPVGGQVDVAGMSVFQAATAIAQKLKSSQVMLNPSVSVNSLEYATQGITLLGEVRKAGTYPLFGTHSLYEALAAAGGVTDDEGATIKIAHPHDAGSPETIDVHSPNYSEIQKSTIVRPGDTIFVSKAEMVYVVGDVVHSGSFPMPYGQKLTVLNAISLAQGSTRTSALSKVALIRSKGDTAQTIQLDLSKVMKNESPNLVLEAGDVLVVPRSGAKTFTYLVLPGAINAVANASAYAAIQR